MSHDQLILVHSLKWMRLNLKILEEAADVAVVVVDLYLIIIITVANNKISPEAG